MKKKLIFLNIFKRKKLLRAKKIFNHKLISFFYFFFYLRIVLDQMKITLETFFFSCLHQRQFWSVWWEIPLNFSLNPFQPSAAFYVEISHLICTANEMTGFCMTCKTLLRLVNLVALLFELSWAKLQWTSMIPKILLYSWWVWNLETSSSSFSVPLTLLLHYAGS